jgi:hypothetical protein
MGKYINSHLDPIGRAIGRNGTFVVYRFRFDHVKSHVWVEVQGIKGTVLNAGITIEVELFIIACKRFLESVGYVVTKNKGERNEK